MRPPPPANRGTKSPAIVANAAEILARIAVQEQDNYRGEWQGLE